MTSFSKRFGYTSARSVIQFEEADSDLRRAVWNGLYAFATAQQTMKGNESETNPLARRVWVNLLSGNADEVPYYVSDVMKQVKERVLNGEWYWVYDSIEYFISFNNEFPAVDDLDSYMNNALVANLSAYRIIDDHAVPIDNPDAVAAVADAIHSPATPSGPRHHLQRAMGMLADRTSPDYANSIKESISAVESMASEITGKSKFGESVRALEAAGFMKHPALKEAWLKLYGYTSDEGGIRHAASAAPTVDQADAKYWLITCSAFVSLLIEKKRTLGSGSGGR